jgi:hypothetical protein
MTTEPALLLAYLCQAYPRPHELSVSRLMKLLYLAEWKTAIRDHRRLTQLRWRFDGMGPHADDVVTLLVEHDLFRIRRRPAAGGLLDVVELRPDSVSLPPAGNDRIILDFVVDSVRDLEWQDLLRLVYSTYPILSSERYSELDLVALAKEYEQELAAIGR